jgi:hypothetical protein
MTRFGSWFTPCKICSRQASGAPKRADSSVAVAKRARRDCSRLAAANPSLRSGPSPLRGDVLRGACGAARRTRHGFAV